MSASTSANKNTFTISSFQLKSTYTAFSGRELTDLCVCSAYKGAFKKLTEEIILLEEEPAYTAAQHAISQIPDWAHRMTEKATLYRQHLPTIIHSLTKYKRWLEGENNCNAEGNKRLAQVVATRVLSEHTEGADTTVIDRILEKDMPFFTSKKKKEKLANALIMLSARLNAIKELHELHCPSIQSHKEMKVEEKFIYALTLKSAIESYTQDLQSIHYYAIGIWPKEKKSFYWCNNWENALANLTIDPKNMTNSQNRAYLDATIKEHEHEITLILLNAVAEVTPMLAKAAKGYSRLTGGGNKSADDETKPND